MLILKGHKDPIQSVAFSPDGTSLLSVDGGSTVRVWELPTGKLRWTSDQHFYSSVAFTPDGKQVLTADLGGNRPIVFGDRIRTPFEMQYPIRVCDVATGAVTPGPFQHPTGEAIHDLTFSPDGTRCVARAGNDNRDLVWWEYPSGKSLPDWKNVVGHEFFRFRHMAFDPDGRTLAGVSPEGLLIFGMPDSEPRFRHPFKVVQGEVRLAYHPDGQRVAYATGSWAAVFDLEARKEMVKIKLSKKHVLALAFTRDGRYLATVSNEETVKFWDPATGQLGTEYAWEVGGLRCVAFARDGTMAAAGGTGKKVVVWDMDS